jgi:hypothetical protein
LGLCFHQLADSKGLWRSDRDSNPNQKGTSGLRVGGWTGVRWTFSSDPFSEPEKRPRDSGENFERSSAGPPYGEFSAVTLGLKNLEFGRKVTRESNPSRKAGEQFGQQSDRHPTGHFAGRLSLTPKVGLAALSPESGSDLASMESPKLSSNFLLKPDFGLQSWRKACP